MQILSFECLFYLLLIKVKKELNTIFPVSLYIRVVDKRVMLRDKATEPRLCRLLNTVLQKKKKKLSITIIDLKAGYYSVFIETSIRFGRINVFFKQRPSYYIKIKICF